MVRLVIALGACLLLGGCFVFEEIDEGMKMMEANSPKKEAPPLSKGRPGTARERLADYYAKQRANAAPRSAVTDPKDQMVRCNIRGAAHFMRRLDCDLRGGRVIPLKGSGS